MSDALRIKHTAEVTLTDLSEPVPSWGWSTSGTALRSLPSNILIPSTTFFKGEGETPQEALQSLTEALEKELAKHDSRADRVAAALKATKDGLPAPTQRHLVS